ncbi:cation diffusion facilitator family transporter [Intestinimonas massiliensis]|jgi:cation diffusion facilitator family transporter|uniref:Cation diffusion facilitator family transporter n=1 Tax=Intestinimonas massiliensis (ex Afouda et al. 2020) TaxID=1673721 RepID=A0ABS9MC03_9FIRM|nr:MULTISPECIES: cation diffusion facilitator family transporter [Intestinimonas]MCG4528293.1 cation diffusion facilitator family transporter [Intestinimonas massiliensis (ex Afouda et al. 2020)]MCI5562004.1 cation diffusion facilitator family transporter [Intestinimonas massiliensis (ex Afouda et al. 2020)]MCQ4806891.1 cation diffusion facilitator family transporter [Intestinimonas massiliensis (ex Afouda et al. 2020)]MDY5338222.1 cation diffusion facilitator family transporter [Intestinimonas
MTDWLVQRCIRRPEDGSDPAVRQAYGLLSGGVGIVLNLLLSAGKFVAGVLTGSIAVTADAFNNLSDAGSSVVTLVGFRMAAKRADDDHPFGHGRIEYLSGLAVAVAILVVGLELAKSSLEKVLHPVEVAFSWLSVGILCASILVKLWMFFFNRNLSRRIGSAAMMATATDSLSDAAATSAVLLGTLVGHFADLYIDGWVGVLVAVFILRAGWGAAKDTLDPLLGQSPDPELVRGIQETVLGRPEIVGMHDLVVHDYGPGRCMASLHAEVPMDADILVIHDVIDNLERELRRKLGVEVVIHMDPIAVGDPRTDALKAQVTELVRRIDPDMTIHDFRMTAGPEHTNLIFDVAVPYHCRLEDEQVQEAIGAAVKALPGNYYTVVSVDHVYADHKG